MEKYGLIGEKLTHSYSQLIHGLLGEYSYELYSLKKEELREFIEGKSLKGFNVTIPYKKEIMKYCHSISSVAQEIGSVNCVICREEKGLRRLYGTNTDYEGFLYMLKRADISLEDKKVLILGSGGTSLTVQTAAKALGAKSIVVVSRRGENTYEMLNRYRDSDIIINTTPVGMYPDNGKRIICLDIFPKAEAVVDVIYNPLYTPLILDARKRGLKYTNGLPMLVAQAKYARDLFLETEGSETIIETVILNIENKIKNIVLIGMPGSGKSTVGQLVAEKLARKYIDTDLEIEKKAGMTIPQIFQQLGEAHFRKLEAEVIGQYSADNGLVIATGGGSILTEENRLNLMQNARIYFLDRDITKLETQGRPLVKGPASLAKIQQERMPLYIQCSDRRIKNNSIPEEAMGEIIKDFS